MSLYRHLLPNSIDQEAGWNAVLEFKDGIMMTNEEFAQWLREQITTSHSRRPSKDVWVDVISENQDLIVELFESEGGGKYKISFEEYHE